MKRLLLVLLFAAGCSAQVYSPLVLRKGQPDPTDLKRFTAAIYQQSGAKTPREKAEAIWRFFLTDGRFVPPGFWYHIAGWAYEEPTGEVLDPMKLINSYGFGLCYHIAPLLEAVFEAGGFQDARVWFLTGHTVTEVFYDGAYHYFDSDMMGYNVRGTSGFAGKNVVSVRDAERDSRIFLNKLASPKTVKSGVVDKPWYPADVREAAIPGLAELFSTTNDNYLYPYTRYSTGHNIAFTLRRGEKLIRYFEPAEPGLFYLPYSTDGKQWREFPHEIAQYQIRTSDGPHSQKDSRLWATGRIEYSPVVDPAAKEINVDMPSPYVIIDATFDVDATLGPSDVLTVQTSTDRGATWQRAGVLQGPHRGSWSVEPAVITKSAHGRLTAVSGRYGYRVRFSRDGGTVRSLHLTSRIQLNPRTLPALRPGKNEIEYTSGAVEDRIELPAIAASQDGVVRMNENGQMFFKPETGKTGTAVFELSAGERPLTGFDAGIRFLDLRNGLAPDKLTAETRHTAVQTAPGTATLEWSSSPSGPFTPLATYPKPEQWLDGERIDRVLLWPEMFTPVRDLPSGTRRVYVRVRSSGPAFDSVRLTVYAKGREPAGQLVITHEWTEDGSPRMHRETIDAGTVRKSYEVEAGPHVRNRAIVLQER